MFKKEAHGLSLSRIAFMGFLAMWNILIGAFWTYRLFWP